MIPEIGKPNILKLTTVVLLCTFLAATQDIVVDGWALNLLQKFVFLFSNTYTLYHIVIVWINVYVICIS